MERRRKNTNKSKIRVNICKRSKNKGNKEMKRKYLNIGSTGMFFFGTNRTTKAQKTASNSLLEIFEDRFRSFLQIMLKKTANNYCTS